MGWDMDQMEDSKLRKDSENEIKDSQGWDLNNSGD